MSLGKFSLIGMGLSAVVLLGQGCGAKTDVQVNSTGSIPPAGNANDGVNAGVNLGVNTPGASLNLNTVVTQPPAPRPTTPPAPKPATVDVSIVAFKFVAPSITVKKGTTVRWTNKDAIGHTVTSDAGSTEISSSILAEGQTYSHTFNTVGTFNYHCTPHPTMKGTVIVTE